MCDWLASELQNAEIEAAAYHAGKDAQQRSRVGQGRGEVGAREKRGGHAGMRFGEKWVGRCMWR